MCGIFALLHPGRPVTEATVAAVQASLRHRGPDDSGRWSDPEPGVTLAQTRLAIQDLSIAGHQPMASASGRYVVTFNGEIYNHLALRQQLEQPAEGSARPVWRGHSDTETLLATIEQWGIERSLRELSGMFAFCVWDRDERVLHLARDRVGEKPLYYGYAGGAFAVASETRAFRHLPGFTGAVDRRALALMMRFLAVPAPYCIYEGFAALPPGTRLRIGLDAVHHGEMPAPLPYWSAVAEAERLAGAPRSFASETDAIDALEQCLGDAVARQMISDVPLGAFLSGGIDSSLVVALMQKHARRVGAEPVRTFSIGFDRRDYNEAHYAKRVAAHLQTRHSELYVSNDDCLAIVPKLADIYDEPFADSSQIAVRLISAMARESVTVALSGDGGDELFGGYNRYTRAAPWWRLAQRMPAPLRGLLHAGLGQVPPDAADRLAIRLSSLLPGNLQIPRPGERLEKLARILAARTPAGFYAGLVEHWQPSGLMLDAIDAPSPLEAAWPALPSLEEQMMLIDLTCFLPTDMLTKVDRAAMSVSLETRLPFLDPAVMTFAWSLPLAYKIRGKTGKWILRQLLQRHLPTELFVRPKMGFNTPVAHWLKGPLQPWAEELLDENRLRQDGYFRPEIVRHCWNEHLSGRRDHAARLWAVLMFQAWEDTNRIDRHRRVT